MPLSFLFYRERLFAKPVRPTEPAFLFGFIFELILALAIWVLTLELGDLAAFTSNAPAVIVSANAFRAVGSPGIYGIRLAMFIAIFRRNRAPQTLEWMVTLAGLGIFIFFLTFGGLLLDGYAGLHGYRRCPALAFRAKDAVFVKTQRCQVISIGELKHSRQRSG